MDLIKSESSTGSSDAGHQKKKRANENLATDESNGAGAARIENPNVEETKKPIESLDALAKAAKEIDHKHLEGYLERYLLQELQLLRFCVHLKEAFSEVSIPWMKMFKESTLSTLIDLPLSQIPELVYDVSNKWIKERTSEKLCKFVAMAGGCIVAEMEAQQGCGKGGKKGGKKKLVTMAGGCVVAVMEVHQGGGKGGKKGAQKKSEVGTFVALAMVLRSRPDALITELRMLRERPTYQGEDKLPFVVWMMAQASQNDLSAGLYAWAHNLLPLMGDKKKKLCSTESMDLILQFVENILSNPGARAILVNGAVREGEPLIPLASFEILLRLTFLDPSARTKATERFEAIYPLLKELALAPGTNTMEQIFTSSLNLAGEGNPVLAEEATAIAIWSLTKNADCFKLWDIVYAESLEVSVALLKKLVDEWKDHSVKLSSSPRDTLTVSQTMKSFRQKNAKAITEGGADCSLYKEADKSCKVISGRVDRGSGRRFIDITTALVVGASGAAIGAFGVTFLVDGLKQIHGYEDCLMCL